MRRIRLIVVGALAGALAAAQPLPKAETILDRYVEVTGGKAAYEKHTHQTMTGTLSFPEQGLSGKLTRYSMAPDKEYSVVELGPLFEGLRVVREGLKPKDWVVINGLMSVRPGAKVKPDRAAPTVAQTAAPPPANP